MKYLLSLWQIWSESNTEGRCICKSALPLWHTSKIFNKGYVDFKWSSPMQLPICCVITNYEIILVTGLTLFGGYVITSHPRCFFRSGDLFPVHWSMMMLNYHMILATKNSKSRWPELFYDNNNNNTGIYKAPFSKVTKHLKEIWQYHLHDWQHSYLLCTYRSFYEKRCN